MPTPFAVDSADLYYEYGGRPMTYVADWRGMPQGSGRAAESTALGGDYLDISARFHKELGLGDVPTHRVSMGAKSVLHSGPEQSPIHDEQTQLGFFGSMSSNEKRLLMIAGVGVAAWFLFLKKKKRK